MGLRVGLCLHDVITRREFLHGVKGIDLCGALGPLRVEYRPGNLLGAASIKRVELENTRLGRCGVFGVAQKEMGSQGARHQRNGFRGSKTPRAAMHKCFTQPVYRTKNEIRRANMPADGDFLDEFPADGAQGDKGGGDDNGIDEKYPFQTAPFCGEWGEQCDAKGVGEVEQGVCDHACSKRDGSADGIETRTPPKEASKDGCQKGSDQKRVAPGLVSFEKGVAPKNSAQGVYIGQDTSHDKARGFKGVGVDQGAGEAGSHEHVGYNIHVRSLWRGLFGGYDFVVHIVQTALRLLANIVLFSCSTREKFSDRCGWLRALGLGWCRCKCLGETEGGAHLYLSQTTPR